MRSNTKQPTSKYTRNDSISNVSLGQTYIHDVYNGKWFT